MGKKAKQYGYVVDIKQYCTAYEEAEEPYGPHYSAYCNVISSYMEKISSALRYPVYPDVTSIHDLADGETAWVVWVEISTGDSFGNAEGSMTEVMGVFKDAATAAELKQQIEEHADESEEYAYSFKTSDGQKFAQGSAPWKGYFEKLAACNIDQLLVVTS